MLLKNVQYCPNCKKFVASYDDFITSQDQYNDVFCKKCRNKLTDTGVTVENFDRYSSDEKEALLKKMEMPSTNVYKPPFSIWIVIIAVSILVLITVLTDVGTWIAYIFGGLMIIFAVLHFVYGSRS